MPETAKSSFTKTPELAIKAAEQHASIVGKSLKITPFEEEAYCSNSSNDLELWNTLTAPSVSVVLPLNALKFRNMSPCTFALYVLEPVILMSSILCKPLLTCRVTGKVFPVNCPSR